MGSRAKDIATHCAAALALVAMLAACDESPAVREAAPQGADSWRRYQAELNERASRLRPDAAPVRAPYALVIFHDRAVHRDADQVDAVAGKGYPDLRAFVYARGVPRKSSPVANVKPVCRSATECEYLPSRKGSFAERYTVSLDGDASAQLRSEKDEVVIAARSLAFARRTIVTVTLVVPGSAPVSTRIVYAPVTS